MSDYRRMQAAKAGYKAALEGRPRSVCNRQRGTIFFDDWHDGYNEGERARKVQP